MPGRGWLVEECVCASKDGGTNEEKTKKRRRMKNGSSMTTKDRGELSSTHGEAFENILNPCYPRTFSHWTSIWRLIQNHWESLGKIVWTRSILRWNSWFWKYYKTCGHRHEVGSSDESYRQISKRPPWDNGPVFSHGSLRLSHTLLRIIRC